MLLSASPPAARRNWDVTLNFTSPDTVSLNESVLGQPFVPVPFYTAIADNPEEDWADAIMYYAVGGNTTQFAVDPITGVVSSRYPLYYLKDPWALVLTLDIVAIIETESPPVMGNMTLTVLLARM